MLISGTGSPSDILRHVFGHADFRHGQEQIVQTLLQGRSALALFPTSAGKSLCYQLPAILMEGVALIISPLIALMKDQVQALQSRGISAARLDSSLSVPELQRVYESLRKEELKLLYIAPERLMNEAFVEQVRRWKISFMAVDEAHCISEWGHNFRPEYLRLAHVARDLRIQPVLALTATATPDVAKDIRQAFGIAHEDHVQTSFHRPNLHYRITPCPANDRKTRLTQALKKMSGAAIVYVTLQQTAEEVATHLQRNGLLARAYHAGLPDDQRHEAQDLFMTGQVQVIVATIAFGMGIDKSDIRAVYHFNLPKTIENYMQETGRAGRDGKASLCELLACRDDCITLENFTYGDTPTPQALRQLVDSLLRQGEEFDFSVYDLSQSTDIRPLVIETVLTHLELTGVMRPLGSFYSNYQYHFVQPEARILSGHKPERQAFLHLLFGCGKRGRKWTTLNLDEAAEKLGEPRERILKALTWLKEAGDINLKPSGARQRYRLCEDASQRDVGTIAHHMLRLFAERETRDVTRLRQVLDLTMHRGCLTRHLLAYFGENLAQDCGTCTSCRERAKGGSEEGPREIPRSPQPGIAAEDVGIIRELLQDRPVSLRSPRQLARFLCGISSPATTRERLTRHDAFGLLSHVPFSEVLTQAEAMY